MKEKEHWIYCLAKKFYAPVFKKTNGVTLKNDTDCNFSNGPYFLISNHVGTHDPIEISSVFIPRMIHWITGAYLFKLPFVGWVMRRLCQCIPKQQGRGDFETMRNIKRAFDKGWIVGIFPEGTRTWDGELMPVNYPVIAKMIRSFDVPTVLVNLEGGYAHEPRWAVKRRKGPVTVHVKRVLSSEEIKSLSLDELQKEIEENFHFSNDEWKKTVEYNYKSSHRAEGLQRVLYMCPKCRQIQTLKTEGNKISCLCGFEAELNEKDDILSENAEFTTVPQWHNWEAANVLSAGGFKEERGCLFQIGDSNDSGSLLDLSKDVIVWLSDNILRVRCTDGIKRVFEFPLCKITSFVLNAKQTMEFFCEDRLYRLRLLSDASSLKYYEYYLSFNEEGRK